MTEPAAHVMVADVVAKLAAEPGRTYTIDHATVVLVHHPTRPQDPPKLGVRVTGTVTDGATTLPVDRIYAVTPSANGYTVTATP
jgi:hypothetical protein